MHVIVCIKQVPDTTNVKINPETNTLMRDGVESILNPFDEYDKMDGKYYVLTVTGDSDNIIVKNNGNTIVNTNPEKAISNGIAYIKKKKEYKIYLPYHEKYEVEVDKSATILLSYFDTDIEELVESVPSINSGIYSF